jgi:hypothetical protein
MNKNRSILFLSFITIAAITYIAMVEKDLPMLKTTQAQKKLSSPFIDEINLRFDGKKVLGLPPGNERTTIRNLRIANRSQGNWKPGLHKALMAQGGNLIKDIKVEELDSFIWNESGIAIHVETVKISLKNAKNETTVFNAMVDSETGKILQNWNQPIIDNFDKRDNYKIKIDPRYLNE